MKSFRGGSKVACSSAMLVLASLLLLVSAGDAHAQVMQSSSYSLARLVQVQGSGFRSGSSHQISADVISNQPVGVSSSISYSLWGAPLIRFNSEIPDCGVVVEGGLPSTSSVDVTVDLICSHPTGCSEYQLSNNGVAYSTPLAYSTSANWSLLPNDGTRRVFAKYKSGLGVWSGPCYDTILLDTQPPVATISPTGGTYMSSQAITVTPSEPSTIDYTIDGSDPTSSPSALEYTAPVLLTDDATLKAVATDAVGFMSPVASETYEICTGIELSLSGYVYDATRQNAPVPLAMITLDNGASAENDPTGYYEFLDLPRGFYTITSVTTGVSGYVTYQSNIELCDDSVVHDILLTKDATVYGRDTNSGYSAEGVNTSTGNFAYTINDLALPGRGLSFVFDRSYNSQDGTFQNPVSGPLGFGWTWNYNISLAEAPTGEVIVRWGDGKTEVWAPDGSGGYDPMYGVFSTLTQNPDSTFTLKRKDLVEYRFDSSDRLAEVVDEFSNAITFTYSAGQLVSITDTVGRNIGLTYDGGRIAKVSDPTGRSVSFSYNPDGDLASATDLANKTTLYTYDSSHRLLSIRNPEGHVVVSNTYDPVRNVVLSQRDAVGGETRFIYDVPNKVTTIIDAESNTSRHYFDDLLRLVEEEDARGNSIHRTYDAAGNLETIKDKNGNATTYIYDGSGNILSKSEPLGRITQATYDAANNPVTKTDARVHLTAFDYDPVTNNLIVQYACGAVSLAACKTDPNVAKTTYDYDNFGQLIEITEAAGHPILERSTTYQYDSFGNRVAVIDALNNSSTFAFDELGRKSAEFHPLGRAAAYEYDAMDRLVLVTDAKGGATQFIFNDDGNKTAHIDAEVRTTAFSYDAKGRLTAKTDALLGEEQYGYDGIDRLVSFTNARLATSNSVYDAVGNLTQQIDAGGNVIRHEYDPNGNRTATIDARGYRTEFTYDELNRMSTLVDPLGNTTRYQYDLNGNLTQVTNARDETLDYSYDEFDRLHVTSDAEGNTTTHAYDLLGRLIGVEDGRTNSTLYEYDKLGRLIKVTDPKGEFATATYDALGNRTAITDPREISTTYAYDVLNRKTSETDPLLNSTSWDYDAVGNLRSVSNADGTTGYTYDDLNRITEVIYPDFTTAIYTYDTRGNRTSVNDVAGTTSYSYDLLDRLSSVTDVFGLSVDYLYDPAGNRSAIRYPGNRLVTYLFDELDRLKQVQDWGGVATTYDYDVAGRLVSQTMGNGVTVSYSYDDADRLVSKQDEAPGGGVIASYSFLLDGNGNRVTSTRSQPLLPEVPLIDQVFAHNDDNQVESRAGVVYTYDGKGNRKTSTQGAVITQFDYDFNNRLLNVTDGVDTTSHLYTSDGHRVSSTVGGLETRYLLDINSPMEMVLATLAASNSVDQYYIYGDGLLYSVDGGTGERLFYHYDPVGSTIARTDIAGQVTESYAYLPYGELLASVNAMDNPFTFVGRFGVMKEDNGLYFMRARFYDTNTRSFLSRDPLAGSLEQPQTLNPYIYSLSNPVQFVDANGKFPWKYAIDTAMYAWGATESYEQYGLPGFAAESGVYLAASYSTPAGLAASSAWFVAKAYLAGRDAYNGDPPDCSEYSGSCNIGSLIGGSVRGISALFDPEAWDSVGSMGAVPPLAGASYHLRKAWAWSTSPLYSRGPASEEELRAGQEEVEQDAEQAAREAWKEAFKDRTRNLNVSIFASESYGRAFKHVLASDFLDRQTRAMVEMAISYELAGLQRTRYGYKTASQKRREKERLARDIGLSISRLYSQLSSALSKHQVIIRDLSALPAAGQGGIVQSGVYAGGN